MIPAAQLILSIAVSIFGAKVLGLLGIQAPSTPDDSTGGRVLVMQDHPAAQAPSATPTTGGTGTAPATSGPKSPGVKDLAGKALDNGWVTWGLAAVLFALPLAISQTRAGLAEAGAAGASIYNEGKAGYRRIDEADDYTANKARTRRRR